MTGWSVESLEFSLGIHYVMSNNGWSRHERIYIHAWTKSRAGIWVMWADRLAFSHSERIWPGIGPRPVGGPNKSPRVITPLVLRPWYRFLPRTPTLTDRGTNSRATLNPLAHTSCSSSPLLFLLRAFSLFFTSQHCSPSISPSPSLFFPFFFFFLVFVIFLFDFKYGLVSFSNI